MHNYLTWLLRSPLARAPYVVLFNLKLLIEDSNLQVYMHCVHARKRASGAPKHNSGHVKSQNFLGPCPQTPFTQSIMEGPHFLYLPWMPPILSGPWPLGLPWKSYEDCACLFGCLECTRMLFSLLWRYCKVCAVLFECPEGMRKLMWPAWK